MRDDLPLLGFGLPVSGDWATPGAMLRVARRAEERGWASLWTFQRLLSPVDGGTGPGGRAGDDDAYRAVHDALLPLAFVASHTERIGLGTATVCAPFTAPVALAKAATTLDHLSGGRFTLGVGMGWMPEEHTAAGVPFERRGARFEEYLRCLRALWTEDPVEFAGEFYTVPRSHVGPAPVQRPHPPVLVGGEAPNALRRAGRLAQGWIGSTGQDPSGLAEAVARVREGAVEAGRDPEQLRILVRTVVDLDERAPGQVLDDLARWRADGVTEVLVDLNFAAGGGDVGRAERVLDALAPA